MTELQDPLPIPPWTQPCTGEIRLPGSKSITNRALILAALTRQSVTLHGALFSRDTEILINALGNLGFHVRADQDSGLIEVQGCGGLIPAQSARLFVGNAGTAARFLTAFVCLHPQGVYDFDGDPEMRLRPMRGLVESLQAIGAHFEFFSEYGCFPFRVHTKGLVGGGWSVDANASSQMLSALMLVAPFAQQPVYISAPGVRPSFVRMTATMMGQFGAQVETDANQLCVISPLPHYFLPASAYTIEPDVSAASYFIALPLVVGGSLRIHGLAHASLQGDLAFARVMERWGLRVKISGDAWDVSFLSPVPPDHGDCQVSFNHFSDTFLTLAAIAPLLPAAVSITDIGHTRHQETDRIAAMANELQRVGASAVESPSSLKIHPFPSASLHNAGQAFVIQTYHDHRVAMSFAILGCANRHPANLPWIHIADPSCCRKTFPGFFQALDQLYRFAHDSRIT